MIYCLSMKIRVSKSGDQWVVPLCATHHGLLHDQGKESDWWKVRDIDPIAIAETLWKSNVDKQ